MIPLRDINPTQRKPVLVYLLLAANVVAFLYVLRLPQVAQERLVLQWGFVPYFFTHELHLGSLSTPLTSMFLHAGWTHLGLNMWFLYVFGDNVEDALGRPRFIVFYLAAGLFAAFCQLLVEPGSRVPMVGASGAIAGVLGAYFRLFPGARVQAWVLLFVIEVPAVVFIFVWFLLEVVSGIGSLGMPSTGGGIAFFAHIGGFLAGLLLVSVLRPVRGRD